MKKFKLGMEKPPLLSRGGKNSRRQNRREIQNYEAFPRVPPSDAGKLKITLEKEKASPLGSAQVQFIAGNGESSAFFGGVNFSLPGTWRGFSIFHSLNFFTASGNEGEGDDLLIHPHPRPPPSRDCVVIREYGVIPAKAGIQALEILSFLNFWMPACAGMTNYDTVSKGGGKYFEEISNIFCKNLEIWNFLFCLGALCTTDV